MGSNIRGGIGADANLSYDYGMKKVYIFDVDGVLNGLNAYEPDGRVLEQVGKLLEAGSTIAFNTGRGYEWVEQTIISGIREHLSSSEKLDRLFVAAEMGGVTVEFKNGVEQRNPSVFSLRQDQIQRAKELFDEYVKDGSVMHWDAEKVSMATAALNDGADIEVFATESAPFAARMRDEFAGQHVRVHHNPVAVDVMRPEAGKWAGAQLIYEWLQRTPDADATDFVCFGDSPLDYEMARFFSAQGHGIEFVFTGKSLGETEHDPKVVFTKTNSLYSEGTFEYLKQAN